MQLAGLPSGALEGEAPIKEHVALHASLPLRCDRRQPEHSNTRCRGIDVITGQLAAARRQQLMLVHPSTVVGRQQQSRCSQALHADLRQVIC